MPGFVTMPVPEHLVTAVMRFIADQTQDIPLKMMEPTVEPSVEPSFEGDDSRDWSREQFEMLNESDAPSVRLFASVLSLLADASPDPIPLERLAELAGVADGLKMQNTFGPVTKWMRNRMDGDPRWPIVWPGGGWAMNARNAQLWKEVTA